MMAPKLKRRNEKIASLNRLGSVSAQGLSSVSSLTKNVSSDDTSKEQTYSPNEIGIPEKNDDINKNIPSMSNDKYQAFIKKSNKNIQKIDVSLLDNAPPTLNIFPKLTDTKLLYLKMSIINNGLFDPIIIWRKPNGRYMILSGHNRVNAYRELLTEYDNEYNQIDAIIYDVDELDLQRAKEIIIDTNFIQRGELGPKLRAHIIKERMDIYKNQKDKKGRRIDELAKELGLKKSAIYEDIQLIEKLIPEIQNKYFNNEITRKAALKAATLSLDLQRELIEETYSEYFDTKHLLRIKKEMNREEILKIFTADENRINVREIKMSIPSSHYDEFMQMYEKFLQNIDEEKKTIE